jgi:hypothetical protein
MLARVCDGHVSPGPAQHTQQVLEQASRSARLDLGEVLAGESRLRSELGLRQAASSTDLGNRAPEIFSGADRPAGVRASVS